MWEHGGRATEGSQLADSPFEFARMVLARSSVGGLEAALWRLKELQLQCGLEAWHKATLEPVSFTTNTSVDVPALKAIESARTR